MDDARERFLRAIAERIPAERIAELHLFPPLRQGGRETGVAVIAVWPDERFVQGELPPPVGRAEGAAEGAEAGAVACAAEGASVMEAIADSLAGPEDGAGAPPRLEDDGEEPGEPDRPDARGIEAAPEGDDAVVRLTVYRAGYRWTRKGVDRGKWEVELRAEADAPLEAVDDVVRGVHRRAGGEAEPERLSGDAVRAALAERPWATTT